MEEQGLAGQSMGQPQLDMEMVKQVAQMLMQGMSPEELMQKGVPREVIEAAMQMIQQQQAQSQQAGPEGLAGQYVQSAV